MKNIGCKLLTCVIPYNIIVAMNTLDIDNPREVLAYLTEPIRAIYEGLDHGLSFAEATLSGMPRDPWVHSHLVRFAACCYLQEITTDRWVLRVLGNSGLEVHCEPLVLKVLKSSTNAPPPPGPNEARQEYWCQQQLRLPLEINGQPLGPSANLIIDWDIGPNENILLALSKPIGTWKYRGQPELEWRRHITIDPGEAPKFIPAAEDILVEFKFDLAEKQGEE